MLYEMAALKLPFEAIGIPQLCLKIAKSDYTPIPNKYSKAMRLLISDIFKKEPKSRPSASTFDKIN
jgi:serine/threonine protein kinase